MGLVYRKKQRVNSYECTYDYRLSPVSMMNYFQQTSQEQSEILDVGWKTISDLGLAWFLVKYDLKIMEYPKFNEDIIIETEPVSFKGFASHRRFTVFDANGKVMAEALTEWMMMDLETGHICRVDEVEANKAYQADGESTFPFRRLKRVNEWEKEKGFHVRYLDIDFNTHVNHVKYLAWALEILPLDIVKKNRVSEVKIIYKNQGFYGDNVKVSLAEIGDLDYRVDVHNQEDVLLCQLELKLEKKED